MRTQSHSVQGNVLALFRVHNRTPRENFVWYFLPNLEKSSEPNSGHESFGPSFQSSIAPLVGEGTLPPFDFSSKMPKNKALNIGTYAEEKKI